MRHFKLLSLLWIFVLGFLAKSIYAANPNRFEFGKKGELYITRACGLNLGEIHLKLCYINESKRKVYCDFKDAKYSKLYLSIPITKGDKITSSDAFRTWDLYYEHKGVEYLSDKSIASTSMCEIIEAGDTYRVIPKYRPQYFEFFMRDGKVKKFYYDKVYVCNKN